MIKTTLMLVLGVSLMGSPAVACPCDHAAAAVNDGCTFGLRLAAIEEPSRISAAEPSSDDEAALEAAYVAEEQATAHAMRAWMQSLASGLIALFAVALAALGLARLGNLRRPLPMTILARRPVPAAVILSLLSPVVPPLVLMHAEREILPSPVLLMASACAALALSMLLARRRLATRLRWAVLGPLAGAEDGALVMAEIAPKKLVAPAGARGRVPWFLADLAATAEGEPARIALGQADVDERAARVLSKLANGLAVDDKLTILGTAARVPADAAAADPLCREAPMQARIGRGAAGRALIAFGTPAELLHRLHVECIFLALLFGVCLGAAGLAFFS
jgi:hypothetical protein